MAPLTCANCGHLFMQTNMEPDAPRYCNNCVRTQIKPPPAPPNPNEAISILIKLSREMQIEIEEYCINQGKTFSEYFVYLHEERKIGTRLILERKMVNRESMLKEFPLENDSDDFKDEGAEKDLKKVLKKKK